MTTANPQATIYSRLGITPHQLADFCQHWQIAELALFGSILRDDFTPSSDIDILVTYLPTAQRGLFEIIGEATKRLSSDFRSRHPTMPWKEMAGIDAMLFWNAISYR